MPIKLIKILFIVSFLLFACSKKTKVIEDNNAPIDTTIEDITIENFIQKTSINLLGRKANPDELSTHFNALKVNPSDTAIRKFFLIALLQQAAYIKNELIIQRGLYLNNADSAEFTEYKTVFEFILTTTNNPIEIALYTRAIERIQRLIDLENNLITKQINFKTAHEIFVDNPIYDDINMGTENFVVACFQNFLFRYPTFHELESSKTMIDGAPAILFKQSGKNKRDFIRIFFENKNYVEGLVIAAYERFLYRTPSALEIEKTATKYIDNEDYTSIKLNILLTNEYFEN